MANKDALIKPSDLRRVAQRLLRTQTMSNLDEVLKAVAESRTKYRALILAARGKS